MAQRERVLLEEVDRLSGDMVELCRSLVRINTVNPYSGDPHPGSERDGQLFLRPILEDMGGAIRLFDPPEDIYERMNVLGPSGRIFSDRPNLVAEFDLGGPGPRIVINGHMDTVAALDMTIDPFCAEVHDGRIWGRGTSDCKGGLSMGLTAIRALLKFREDLSGSIVYESVVDEECSGSGAGTLACCHEGHRGDMCIVVDGNDLRITTGCGGCLTADVHVTGRTAHAAMGGGISAVDKAIFVKRAIDDFKAERECRFPDAKLNLGVFRAGVHPAVVPGHADLSLNIVYKLEEADEAERASTGWGGGPIRQAFEDALAARDAEDDWLSVHPSEIVWVKDLIPFQTPEDSALVTGLATAFEETVGRRPEIGPIAAWGDAAWLARKMDMPAVMFGPGVEPCCHAPDEYIEISHLTDGCKALALFLFRMLR